jgi:hypothetical protein
MGHHQKLEISRHRWITSKNLSKHYEVLRLPVIEVLLQVETGIMVQNPEYDPSIAQTKENQDDSLMQLIFIIKPDCHCLG